AELSGHPGEEVEEGGERLRLGAQGKNPRVAREVNHHEIVLVTRHAGCRSGPQITVNQIKHMRCMRRGGRKRKANMATQQARVAKMLSRSPSARNVCTTTKLSQSVAVGVTKPAVPGGGIRSRGESIGQRRRRSWRWSSG